MIKVKIIKAFVHDGKAYNIGDTFEGSQPEVDALVRQGYVDAKPAAEPADTSEPNYGDASAHHTPTTAHKK